MPKNKPQIVNVPKMNYVAVRGKGNPNEEGGAYLSMWCRPLRAFGGRTVIRLPDFVTKKDFGWAVETAAKKKKLDCSLAEFLTIEEGLCIQIMHIGAFDDEPATVALMDEYLQQNCY